MWGMFLLCALHSAFLLTSFWLDGSIRHHLPEGQLALVLVAIGWWRQIIRLSSLNGEDACYAVSVLLPGMIRLTAFMCCCGGVGEMETQSMYPQMEPASMLLMQTEVIFRLISRSCVFKCPNDATCTALEGVKTGCFSGNEDFGTWGSHRSLSVIQLMLLGSKRAPPFVKSLRSLSFYLSADYVFAN